MRWILCAKNTAAAACLEHLVARGDEVWAIGVAGDDGQDGWQRSLCRRAGELGVRFAQPRRINAPEMIERLAAYRADALISIQYDQILKAPLFRAVGCPTLNFHFALLPRHRGVSPMLWAVLEGDAEAGVTLHHMVEEIDAGDVVAQRAVPIASDDSARDVYEKVSRATVELFRDSYPFPPALLARRLPQDAARASYHRAGDFDFQKRAIVWDRPAAELHRWIRAMIFPPLQSPETTLADRRWVVTRLAAALGGPVTEPPGTVVSRTPEAVVIAARDRALLVRELRPAAGGDGPEIMIGDRFV